MSNSSNKQIAKNTVILYLRMALSMLVSLYTSRVVLRELGAVDYGLNNVIAGVVAMFSFLNASMSGATSRFLTFHLGKNDVEELKRLFGAAKTIHLFIAILVVILAETIGLYFLEHKLVIPDNRMFAAKCIFQFCIIGSFFTITQVPYSASVFSHEKMTLYAVLELCRTFLNLGAVFLLSLGDDRLIFWGMLTLGTTILLSLSYRIYCWTHFPECRSGLLFEKHIVKPMLTFSGWDLYGNLSVMARTQGVNMLLNMFFGPLMNAAAGVATSVQGAVMSLSSNLVTAMRPQIVKRYAQGEISSMLKLLNDVSKLAFLLISVLTIPLIVESKYVLSLWLGNAPEHAAEICIFVLLFNVFANQSVILVSVIHATGKIFRPSFINGTLYLLVVPISFIAFKFGGDYWISFLVNVLAVFCGMLSNAWTIHLYIPEFSFGKFVVHNLIPCLLIFVLSIVIALSIRFYFDESLFRLIFVCFISSVVLSFAGYKLLLSKIMQQEIIDKIKGMLCRNH